MKKNNLKAASFVIGLFAILAVAFIAIGYGNKGNSLLPKELSEVEVSNEGVIYLDGDTYHYKNESKDVAFDKIVEESDPDKDTEENKFKSAKIAISPDGKYGYYFTTFDGLKGKLKMAELKKLKDGKDNSDHIYEIADNAEFDYTVLPTGIVYSVDTGSLYYYNNKESVNFANNVIKHGVGDKSVVYETRVNNKISLYSQPSDFEAEPTLITENYSSSNICSDNTMVIFRDIDSKNKAVSVYTEDNGLVDLTESTDFCFANVYKNVLYYTTASDNKIMLYNFVKDEYEEEDQHIVKPEKDDYSDKKEYYKVREKYDDAVKRIELREILKTTPLPVKALYKYVDGTATLVADNVINVSPVGDSDILVYNTVDSIKDNTKINGIGIYDMFIEYLMKTENDKELCITSPTGYTGKLSEEIGEILSKDMDNTEIYTTDTGFYAIKTPENELFYIEADDNGELSQLSFIENDAEFCKSVTNSLITYGDNIYYYSLEDSLELKEFKDRTGALMVYNTKDKESTEIFNSESRVLLKKLNLYNNGVIYFCKANEDNTAVSLYKLENGAESLVTDKLNKYAVYKNAMVVLTDGKISLTYGNDFINAEPEALSEPVGTEIVSYGTNMVKEDFTGSEL